MVPVMFSTPFVPIVSPLPFREPPDQLMVPLKVTGELGLRLPLKFAVSLAPGTPLGVQFLALYQSPLVEPLQV